MNVSIFLRQFGGASSSATVVEWIRDGNSSRLGADRLRALLRILPEQQEVELLTPYIDSAADGAKRLAPAEQFYAQLLGLHK